MKVDDYEKEALEDLKIDVVTIQDNCRDIGRKRAKWARYLYDEQCLLNVARDKLNDLYKEKFHYYAYEYTVKIDKKNIETYINGDDQYRIASLGVKNQETKVKYVNDVLDCIDKQSYQYSNIIKHMIWQSGSSGN